MMEPPLNSFLVTNKIAIRTGLKISISVWGAFLIALLMNFEHPVWAMITGMISFFGPDHAQVLKKCLAQSFATIVGGILGLIIISATSQSPLLAVMCVTAVLFIGSGLAFNTRDMNLTFCCAFSCVTVCLMVMVPAILGPTPHTLIEIFIDRVGTILFGIGWVTFVSIFFWPLYSSDMLKGMSKNLIFQMFSELSGSTPNHKSLLKISNLIVQIEDVAKNSNFESYSSRNAARIARKINELVFKVTSDSLVLFSENDIKHPDVRVISASYLDLLRDYKLDGKHYGDNANAWMVQGNSLRDKLRLIDEKELPPSDRIYYEKMVDCVHNLLTLNKLELHLQEGRKFFSQSLRIRKTFDFDNFIRNGLRTALIFISGYFFWYITSWSYSFLIAVVPVVFSIMFSKLPHAEILTGKALKGILFSLPVGIIINIILAESPSAVELYILIAGIPLFIGLMGLSSLSTFALSLGYNIGYIITILPQNVYSLDVPFAIVRTLAVAIGVFILQKLFSLIPRITLLNRFRSAEELFRAEMRDALTIKKNSHSEDYNSIVARIIDKLTTASMQELDETREQVVLVGSKVFFANRLIKSLIDHALSAGLSQQFFLNTNIWRDYLLTKDKNHEKIEISLQTIILKNIDNLGIKLSEDASKFISDVVPEYDKRIKQTVFS